MLRYCNIKGLLRVVFTFLLCSLRPTEESVEAKSHKRAFSLRLRFELFKWLIFECSIPLPCSPSTEDMLPKEWRGKGVTTSTKKKSVWKVLLFLANRATSESFMLVTWDDTFRHRRRKIQNHMAYILSWLMVKRWFLARCPRKMFIQLGDWMEERKMSSHMTKYEWAF